MTLLSIEGGPHKNKKEVSHMVKDWVEEEGLATEYLYDETRMLTALLLRTT
jgi:hypothetical protein